MCSKHITKSHRLVLQEIAKICSTLNKPGYHGRTTLKPPQYVSFVVLLIVPNVPYAAPFHANMTSVEKSDYKIADVGVGFIM